VGKVVAALLCALAVLIPCGSAAAKLIVGINDDATYESTVPTFFMPTMKADGLKTDAVTIRWDDTQPTVIPPPLESSIASDIAAATAAGVTVELDLYPLHSQALTDGLRCDPSASPVSCGDPLQIEAFAAWVAQVAQTFPTVHQFIVMNECNQPLFLNPQWNRANLNQSAQVCGRALAAAYDALKAVNKANFVWGVGLSPRGNDAPKAPSNSSTSPVHFLIDLGTWFKAFALKTHRTAPLMDGLDFHPYPVPQSMAFTTGYADPDDASVANLSRIYQAFYNGFSGSLQRTIGQQKGGGLPLSLNEMGIQTNAVGQPGYFGEEVSANPAGGMVGADASQAYQATYYLETLSLLACDPNVRVINIFHLVDEPDLPGWQSGLYWFSTTAPTPKLSATVVSSWISTSGGRCAGKMTPWYPVPPVPPTTKSKKT
jgi:hypothetical protein